MIEGLGDSRFDLIAAPHLKGPDSTTRIMWSVVASLVPVVVAAVWFWGPSALVLIVAATVGAVATERFFGKRGTGWLGENVSRCSCLALQKTAGRLGPDVFDQCDAPSAPKRRDRKNTDRAGLLQHRFF